LIERSSVRARPPLAVAPQRAGAASSSAGSEPEAIASATDHTQPVASQRSPSASSLPALDAQSLHPALWRAHRIDGNARAAASPSGFGALDAELPGGGWPHRVLTELLLPHPGLGELRLLAPALARIAGVGRSVMLFDPPAALSGWALAQLGVATEQLFIVYGRDGPRGSSARRRLPPGADLLWALEQALKSGHVGAVLAWLPQRLRADALRRLQLAAQSHDGPAFLFREIESRLKPSAAPLRLALSCAGIDTLAVRVLKRRGPPLAQPLAFVLPPVLTERQRRRAEQRTGGAIAAVDTPMAAAHEEP
jgi:protein ImuA